MREAPHHAAQCTSECLYGEVFELNLAYGEPSATNGHWLHVTAQRDGYEGYIEKKHVNRLSVELSGPTHYVSTRSTLVFGNASIKASVLMRLPFLAKVTVTAKLDNSLYALDNGGYIWAQHLHTIDTPIAENAIAVAHSHFLGAPYLWGGCSPAGVDCSGLVQALAQSQGIAIPRDSHQQEDALKNDITFSERQAHDIVYWPGHTGILVDAQSLLHATAHSLNCLVEPLDDVINRAGKISSIKRLFSDESSDTTS